MLKAQDISIEEVYIPTARRKTLNTETADTLAEDILENGQKTPIQVRQGNGRYVLLEGLHRLEACKLLGEENVSAYVVQSKKF
jgi:sulfiredoxin